MMEKRFAGRPAAPGIALGALFALTTGTGARVASGLAESEADALRSALRAAATGLKDLIERSTGDAAAILEFQVALLEDDVLAEPAFSAIVAGRAADRAWFDAMQQEIAVHAFDPAKVGRVANGTTDRTEQFFATNRLSLTVLIIR